MPDNKVKSNIDNPNQEISNEQLIELLKELISLRERNIKGNVTWVAIHDAAYSANSRRVAVRALYESITQSDPLLVYSSYARDIPREIKFGGEINAHGSSEHFYNEQQNNTSVLVQMEVLRKNIELLSNEVNEQAKEVDSLSKDNARLKEMIYNNSISFDSTSKIQHIPIEIYLDTNETASIFEVYQAVLDFLKIIDFEKFIELDAIKGSWFKRMVARSKSILTSEEVHNRIKEVEYAIETNTILKQQSEIDKNQSEAFFNILKSVENIPNAALRLGSLLVVKVTTKEGEVSVQSRTLTVKELYLINKNPELLKSPQNILSALSAAIEESTGQNKLDERKN